MKIPTSAFYDRSTAAMSTLSGRADLLSTQISTGKRLAAASDDAVAYQQLRGLATASADAEAYTSNLTLADAVLQQADTTLTAVGDQLGRASELAIRARNGTLGAGDRKAIAAELTGIAESLRSLAATRDARGQPLFAGSSGEAVQTVAGRTTFNNAPVAGTPIANGQSVQATENAARIFVIGADGTNSIDVIAALALALTGEGDVAAVAGDAVADLATATTQVSTVQASLGARASRVEMEMALLKNTGIDREEARSALEDTDVTAAITELQKTMTILSATQASFTKLSSLSLFDYLR